MHSVSINQPMLQTNCWLFEPYPAQRQRYGIIGDMGCTVACNETALFYVVLLMRRALCTDHTTHPGRRNHQSPRPTYSCCFCRAFAVAPVDARLNIDLLSILLIISTILRNCQDLGCGFKSSSSFCGHWRRHGL